MSYSWIENFVQFWISVFTQTNFFRVYLHVYPHISTYPVLSDMLMTILNMHAQVPKETVLDKVWIFKTYMTIIKWNLW